MGEENNTFWREHNCKQLVRGQKKYESRVNTVEMKSIRKICNEYCDQERLERGCSDKNRK